jgi:alkane 1-monooxygenase
MVPPLWKRVMNGRVREWRKQNYPDIADWQAYNMGTNALGSGN